MKGLSFEQYREIVNFIQKHHKFGYIERENQIKENWWLNIKYIDNCYDTRTNDIWSITFRSMGEAISFRTNSFVSLSPKKVKFNNLFDYIMAYLLGNLTEEEINYFSPKKY